MPTKRQLEKALSTHRKVKGLCKGLSKATKAELINIAEIENVVLPKKATKATIIRLIREDRKKAGTCTNIRKLNKKQLQEITDNIKLLKEEQPYLEFIEPTPPILPLKKKRKKRTIMKKVKTPPPLPKTKPPPLPVDKMTKKQLLKFLNAVRTSKSLCPPISKMRKPELYEYAEKLRLKPSPKMTIKELKELINEERTKGFMCGSLKNHSTEKLRRIYRLLYRREKIETEKTPASAVAKLIEQEGEDNVIDVFGEEAVRKAVKTGPPKREPAVVPSEESIMRVLEKQEKAQPIGKIRGNRRKTQKALRIVPYAGLALQREEERQEILPQEEQPNALTLFDANNVERKETEEAVERANELVEQKEELPTPETAIIRFRDYLLNSVQGANNFLITKLVSSVSEFFKQHKETPKMQVKYLLSLLDNVDDLPTQQEKILYIEDSLRTIEQNLEEKGISLPKTLEEAIIMFDNYLYLNITNIPLVDSFMDVLEQYFNINGRTEKQDIQYLGSIYKNIESKDTQELKQEVIQVILGAIKEEIQNVGQLIQAEAKAEPSKGNSNLGFRNAIYSYFSSDQFLPTVERLTSILQNYYVNNLSEKQEAIQMQEVLSDMDQEIEEENRVEVLEDAVLQIENKMSEKNRGRMGQVIKYRTI